MLSVAAYSIAADAATVQLKVMRMYTDPTRLRATDLGHVEGNPVFPADLFPQRPDRVMLLIAAVEQGGGEGLKALFCCDPGCGP